MHDEHHDRHPPRPLVLVAMVWLVVLVLSFYGAADVRDEADKNEALQEQGWLQSALAELVSAEDAVGVGALKAKLGAVREDVNAPYTVLVAEDEAPDEPIEVATPDAGAGPVDPEALPHQGPPNIRRVLVVGASSIQFAIGTELEHRIPTYAGVKVKRFGQLATGLSRPDFMDWPKKVEGLAKPFKPDLVIANYGGNDAQGILVDGVKVAYGDTPEWEAAYMAKVKEIVDISRRHGAATVFIGMPNMRSADFAAKMRHLNVLQARAVESEGGLFVPTYAMSSTKKGAYRKTIEYRGKRGLMRTSDGVHYQKLGAAFVVEQVLQAVERRYRLVHEDATLAVAEGHRFESRAAGRWVGYVAFVPRSGAKSPAALLLPDPAEDWPTWPNYPHRELQRLAEKLGRVLVVPDDALTGAFGDDPQALLTELVRDVELNLPVTEVDVVAGAGAGADTAAAFAAAHPELGGTLALFGAETTAPGGWTARAGSGAWPQGLEPVLAPAAPQ
ncbi:MAG: DUF459 domain-containing protein [Myxococcales bacterium]|nr:DUF459 domain-containing protein [Myxococcales bacterium]